LKSWRVRGAETLFLKGTARGTFAVPLDWTDLAEPSPYASFEYDAPTLEFCSLLELVELVETCNRAQKKRVDA
jgi:hypothetical protein